MAFRGLAGHDLRPPHPPVHDWLPGWIARDPDPASSLTHCLASYGTRTMRGPGGATHVVLVHYDDLCADLAGEMRGLAAVLGIAVPERAWPALADAAALRSMRVGAEGPRLHGPPGVLKSRAAFFRRGSPEARPGLLTGDELAGCQGQAAQLALPDLLSWLHSPGHSRPGSR